MASLDIVKMSRCLAIACSMVLCCSLWLVVRHPLHVRSTLVPAQHLPLRYMFQRVQTPELKRFDSHWFALADRYEMNWLESSPECKQSICERYLDLFVDSFNRYTDLCEDPAKVSFFLQLDEEIYSELELACRQALGEDVVLEVVGSRARGTGYSTQLDLDADIQVRRSGRLNVPFTDMDKERVAQSLESLEMVSHVRIGSVAIKFNYLDIPCDLVLWRERPEVFPALRGGHDFYRNSACINAFFDSMPAAKAAARGLRIFLPKGGRPKGILLDAITWRVASAARFPLERAGVPMRHGAYNLFLTVVQEMTFWEDSCFAFDLMHDLSLMSQRERQKYTTGLTRVRDIALDHRLYKILTMCFSETVQHEYAHVFGKSLELEVRRALNEAPEQESATVRMTEVLHRLEWYFENAFSEKSICAGQV
ncbi:unnamed protein product [Symbiodinium sp. CCMP2592]|nr:unnamed protein product [Symbiodinium sp. CCMP2592]